MARAIGIDQLLKMNFKEMKFEGKWKESFGANPGSSGTWIIWAHSGNGKTNFALQLAKYLTQFESVLYDSLEEGAKSSFRLAVLRNKMQDPAVKRKFKILHREPLDELKTRLRKRRSPRIVFIDSIQYTGITKKEYAELKEEFENHLFIFVSHANGKHPKGNVADHVQYDADVKIYVEGFVAFPKTRYEGGKPYIIWNEGAKEYHGNLEL